MKTIIVQATLTSYIVTCGNESHYIHTSNSETMRIESLKIFSLKNAKFKRI